MDSCLCLTHSLQVVVGNSHKKKLNNGDYSHGLVLKRKGENPVDNALELYKVLSLVLVL